MHIEDNLEFQAKMDKEVKALYQDCVFFIILFWYLLLKNSWYLWFIPLKGREILFKI